MALAPRPPPADGSGSAMTGSPPSSANFPGAVGAIVDVAMSAFSLSRSSRITDAVRRLTEGVGLVEDQRAPVVSVEQVRLRVSAAPYGGALPPIGPTDGVAVVDRTPEEIEAHVV